MLNLLIPEFYIETNFYKTWTHKKAISTTCTMKWIEKITQLNQPPHPPYRLQVTPIRPTSDSEQNPGYISICFGAGYLHWSSTAMWFLLVTDQKEHLMKSKLSLLSPALYALANCRERYFGCHALKTCYVTTQERATKRENYNQRTCVSHAPRSARK